MGDGIAFIGFGEAAEAFATGWGPEVAARIRAFDLKSGDPAQAGLPMSRAERTGATLARDRGAALADAGAVFCLVTADQAVAAAEQAAAALSGGAMWFDGNSCSPGAKRRAAAVISAAGGRYVDLAIMAPVYPKLHRTPLLIAGPEAGQAADYLAALGMEATIAGTSVGEASAIKMIRSIMVKGIEALTAECFLAARRAGVEDRVLASLQSSGSGVDWTRQAPYNLDRMMVHGARRAAEMREVAITLAELGLPNEMATVTAEWQQRVGDMRLAPGDEDLATRIDRILAEL
jgi:3-hydroxyisobutyrate dehydrogenase-like beta-hydroxyacid dehydrogenase